MRGKRSKQYKKLMQQYGLVFGFREPFQVLIDAQMIQDADHFAMDLVSGLERVLHGKIKPMITQCSIRHLYTLASVPQSRKDALVLRAKSMERRRCNHHTLDEPLPTVECLSSVIDPKGSHTNKNRYIVASQEEIVRRYCRDIKGVPIVYVKRSVMVMEPMAESSLGAREGFEKGKFRVGIRGKDFGVGQKRKRVDDGIGIAVGGKTHDSKSMLEEGAVDGPAMKVKKIKGPKGPNPLSVKKPRKAKEHFQTTVTPSDTSKLLLEGEGANLDAGAATAVDIVGGLGSQSLSPATKQKRKRRHKTSKVAELLQDYSTSG